jgi:pyridoxamine 5'-phosphate oxidase
VVNPWLDDLQAALEAEFGPGPRPAALATVDRDGRPHARFVICRRIGPDGTFWVASDARSAKAEHLRHQPYAELVFWLAARREQYRVAGPVQRRAAADDPDRLALWRELSDAGRALFAWPTPGLPRHPDPAAFPAAIPSEAAPPASFEALVLRPTAVEHLALNPHPHHRRRWRAETGWAEEGLNS